MLELKKLSIFVWPVSVALGVVLFVLGLSHVFVRVSCPPNSYTCINADNDQIAIFAGLLLSLVGGIGLVALGFDHFQRRS